LTLFAVQQGLRVFKSGPNVIALSCGYAINAMLSNAVRVASLPIAWWAVAVQGGGLMTILAIAIAAEFLGFAVALWQVRWRLSMPVRRSLPAMVLAFAVVLAAGLSGLPMLPAVVVTGAYWARPLLFVALMLAMPELRRHLFARS